MGSSRGEEDTGIKTCSFRVEVMIWSVEISAGIVMRFISRLRCLMEWQFNPARKGMREHATMCIRPSVFVCFWRSSAGLDTVSIGVHLCHAYSNLLNS